MAGYKANLKDVCGCGVEVQGKTKDELINNAKAHAKQAHKMNDVPKELADKLMKAIKEV